MTAESLLVTYIQVGVAISGFSGIVVSLGNRAQGAVVIPRAPAPICFARDKRRVRSTQRITADPRLHWARRADRVVCQQRLLP